MNLLTAWKSFVNDDGENIVPIEIKAGRHKKSMIMMKMEKYTI